MISTLHSVPTQDSWQPPLQLPLLLQHLPIGASGRDPTALTFGSIESHLGGAAWPLCCCWFCVFPSTSPFQRIPVTCGRQTEKGAHPIRQHSYILKAFPRELSLTLSLSLCLSRSHSWRYRHQKDQE